MARYKCPACGAAYNGKRCQACYYEHFTEEIAHGTHTHRGEPLVIDAPVRKPIRRKDPFDCDKLTRIPSKLLSVLISVAIILVAVTAEIIGANVSRSSSRSYAVAEPEILADGMMLYDADGIKVVADWQNGSAYSGAIPVYLVNNSSRAVIASARNVTVNGYAIESAGLYAKAKKKETGEAVLYLDESSLELAGIETVAEITFSLDIYDAKSSDVLDCVETVQLLTDAPADFRQPVDDSGILLFDDEGLKIVYKGYLPSSYSEDFLRGTLLFLVENTSGRHLGIYTSDAFVNGEDAQLYLTCELGADTRCLNGAYLTWLEDLGIDSLDDLQDVAITLTAVDLDGDSYSLTTPELTFSPAQ